MVAHERTGNTPFNAINREFAQRLEKRSAGGLKIQFIISPASDNEVDESAFQEVRDGRADISQLGAASAKVSVFDLPFVFSSYRHAENIFNGQIGRRLIEGVSEASQGRLRGFGFTYSGGYRILAGTVPLRRLDDFAQIRMRNTPTLAPIWRKLGACLVDASPYSRERPITGVSSGEFDLEETEVNRLAIVAREHPELLRKVPYANLTRHRMYVTAIVVNERFFQSLPSDWQHLLREELEALAASERALSVKMEKTSQTYLVEQGVKFVEMDSKSQREFMAASETAMDGYPDIREQVREIRAAQVRRKRGMR